MRRSTWFSRTKRNPARAAASLSAPRRGSTIVVVIALLLALTFLGIVGYTVGTQEYSNAIYFKDGANNIGFGISRDALFDWSLRQIILGTYQHEERQSVLHGGGLSLLPTMYGFNSTPYDGEGVHTIFGPGNTIVVDQDYNASTSDFVDADSDGIHDLLQMNRSPAAGGAGAVIMNQDPTLGYPAPDVGYNYWDINSPYLAYVNQNHVYNSTGATTGVMLPSFHRPQLLRASGIAPDQWYRDPDTQRMVLRPHELHRAVASDGTVTDTPRYVRATDALAAQIGAFPFVSNTGAPANNDANPNNDGIWDGIWNGGLGNQANVSYDADPDNDGYNEAIYMDLGYPMQIRENADGTVTNFVPMFAVTIYDADALFNLNAHGNHTGIASFNNGFGQFGSLGPGLDGMLGTADDDLRYASRSNQGLKPSEVNPQWGMTALPGDGSTVQHQRYFGHAPANYVELANMEWWFLLSGRADLDASNNIDKLYPGRYGEIELLDMAMSGALGVESYPKAGDTFAAFPSPADYVPSPGNFSLLNASHLATDDNLDAQLGGRYNGDGTYFPGGLIFPAWQQPLDLHGSGRQTNPLPPGNANYGRQRLTRTQGQHPWPAYMGYQHNHEIGLWANANSRFLMLPGSNALRYNVDEPEEMILEPQYVRSDYDSIFGAAENATLHLSQADQEKLGFSGRLRDLAPVNFDGRNTAAEERRRRFTTTSWDLKSLTVTDYTATASVYTPPNAARTWEYTGGTFPPANLMTMNPSVFRCPDPSTPMNLTNPTISNSPVVELLRTYSPPDANFTNFNLRRLSINHLVDWESTAGMSNLIFRPLTPHPENLGPEAINPFNPMSGTGNPKVSVTYASRPSSINTPEEQEWFARRDRQQLCRDIYTLMYLFCGGDDAVNFSATNNPYTIDADDTDNDGTAGPGNGIPDQLELMAQFAVNLVDRMDPDDISTKFEFDVNLANGWNLDDDPFTDSTGTPTPGYSLTEAQDASISNPLGERGVVYGVEEQKLALNEAQIIFAPRVRPGNMGTVGQDHQGTDHDDSANRDFTFIELENVSRDTISFATEAWQIAVRPPVTSTTATGTGPVIGQERRLTFTGTHPGIGWGSNSVYVIGAAGDETNVIQTTTPISDFRVNRNHKNTEMGTPNEDTHPESGTVPYPVISPRLPVNQMTHLINQPNYYDLIRQGASTPNQFRIHQAGAAGQWQDGAELTGAGKGGELLSLAPTLPDDITDQDDRGNGTNIKIEVELRRRLNPTRQPANPIDAAQSKDNPWIVVDKITVPLDVFALKDTDDFDEIRGQLDTMRTYERQDPLIRDLPKQPLLFAQTIPVPNQGHWQNNSLGLPNILGKANHLPAVGLYTAYGQYQPHFNRDFGSVMELLTVPLYGPGDLTSKLAQTDTTFTVGRSIVAADKFLHPEPITPGVAATGNRWYRLFEFVEVPDRSHRHPELNAAGVPIRPSSIINLGNRNNLNFVDPFYRRPGRLQLNTMRHPEVLGGLLDDPEVANLSSNPALHLPDQGNGAGSGAARDWWVQFVQARDGIDPVIKASTGQDVFLPGLPSANPFRPFSYSAEGPQSLQNTLLRKLPLDGSGLTARTLFELGNQNQATSPVDHDVRYRMFEKVANNSTTRSNVFLIFIQVDFFEAREVTDSGTGKSVVRVGAKLTDSPAYRGFFVVDRSKAKYLLGTQDFPQAFTDKVDGQPKFNYSFNQNFDFHQLILHRQTIN